MGVRGGVDECEVEDWVGVGVGVGSWGWGGVGVERGGGDVRNSQLISAKDFPIQIHPVIVIDKSNIYEGSK